jgi:predicted PurR-regulated permease PerM
VTETGNRGQGAPNAASFDLAIQLGLIALLAYWALLILRPMLAVMIWSIVLAVALYPLFDWLATILGGRRRLAAILVTFVCLLIVIGPMAWVGLNLIDSVQDFSRHLEREDLAFPSPREAVKSWPLIGEQLFELWDLASTNFKAAFSKVAPQLKPLGGSLIGFAGTAGIGILMFMVSLAIAGFLFAPGPKLVDALKKASRRVAGARGDEFVDLAGSTIRKVARGVIGIAILQAGLAGIGMSVAHIPVASLLTFLALVLGIVQIGPSIVLIPVIIWSWTAMDSTWALLFTAYMVPVCIVDNILRPLIMGRGLASPMPVVFAGLIGGVLVHGMIGIFIGPIILSVAWVLLIAWVEGIEPDVPSSESPSPLREDASR